MTEVEIRELQTLAEALAQSCEDSPDRGWEVGGGAADGSTHFVLTPDDDFVAITHSNHARLVTAEQRARYLAACSPERIAELCRLALRMPSPCTKCSGSTEVAAVEMSTGVYCSACIVGMDIEPGTVARMSVMFVDPAAWQWPTSPETPDGGRTP